MDSTAVTATNGATSRVGSGSRPSLLFGVTLNVIGLGRIFWTSAAPTPQAT